MRVAHHVFQQAVAFAHRLFIGQHGIGVQRFEAERRAIQKPPPPFGPFDPKPVHRRHQPQDAGDAAQRHLRGGLAVNAELPGLAGFGPCFDFMVLMQGLQMGGDFPPQRLWLAGKIIGTGTAQPPTGGQERDGFEQVRLARAIGPKNRHRARVQIKDGAFVAAEMRQRQLCQRKPGHQRREDFSRKILVPVTRASA